MSGIPVKDAYGSIHKRQRRALMYRLKDGEECEVCGEPMFRDPLRNFDDAPLEADHLNADTSRPASRLVHRHCNRSLITKWVKHGPGWYSKHGGANRDIDVQGGEVTTW